MALGGDRHPEHRQQVGFGVETLALVGQRLGRPAAGLGDELLAGGFGGRDHHLGIGGGDRDPFGGLGQGDRRHLVGGAGRGTVVRIRA